MNTPSPAWLPQTISYSGDWHTFINVAYSVFEKQLKKYPKPVYRGHIVFHDNRCLDSREEGFWHLVTRKDRSSGVRLPEVKRAERLTWIRAIIENCGSKDVTEFDYKEGSGRVRTYLWLRVSDFVVILEKRKQAKTNIAMLVTAYCVDNDSARKNLERKWNDRL